MSGLLVPCPSLCCLVLRKLRRGLGSRGGVGTMAVQCMDPTDSLVGICCPCGRDGQPRPGRCPVGLSRWTQLSLEGSSWVPGGLEGAGGGRRNQGVCVPGHQGLPLDVGSGLCCGNAFKLWHLSFALECWSHSPQRLQPHPCLGSVRIPTPDPSCLNSHCPLLPFGPGVRPWVLLHCGPLLASYLFYMWDSLSSRVLGSACLSLSP